MPVYAAIGERRKGVARPEFSDCGVGSFACVLAGLFGSALSEAIAIAIHFNNVDVVGDTCPSSNDLRLFVFLKIGVSGSVWGLI